MRPPASLLASPAGPSCAADAPHRSCLSRKGGLVACRPNARTFPGGAVGGCIQAARRLPPPLAATDWATSSAFDASDLDPELAAEAAVFGLQPPTSSSSSGRAIQWYPGHIARAERRLRAAIAGTDVVIEVRDARCPGASAHPGLAGWVGPARPRLLVLNRVDQVSPADRDAWDAALRAAGEIPLWTDGAGGAGVGKLRAAAAGAACAANARRAGRGLAPRPARAAVVGMPNVGKSALINRLLGRRIADSAPRPGVTRDLRWCRVKAGGSAAAAAPLNPGTALDLLDAPGVLPPSIADQAAAARLAACNDIGGAAYSDACVAADLVDTLAGLARGGGALGRLSTLARVPWPMLEGARPGGRCGDDFVRAAAAALFQGDVERAGARILKHYRQGALGALSLEEPL